MLVILSAFLFALSCNLDNLVIGIAYGTKNIAFSLANNLLVATITTIGTFLSMIIGKWLFGYLPVEMSNGIGAGIMLLLGIYFVLSGLRNIYRYRGMRVGEYPPHRLRVEHMMRYDKDDSGHIDAKEALVIAGGLTLSNIGAGIAASMTGGHLYWILGFNFILSVVSIELGIIMGRGILGKIMGKYGSVFAGLMLISLGILELIYQ